MNGNDFEPIVLLDYLIVAGVCVLLGAILGGATIGIVWILS